MPLQVQQTIPILRIFDLHKAKEFYVLKDDFALQGSDITNLSSASSLSSGHVWLAGTFTSLHLPPFRPFVLFTDQGR